MGAASEKAGVQGGFPLFEERATCKRTQKHQCCIGKIALGALVGGGGLGKNRSNAVIDARGARFSDLLKLTDLLRLGESSDHAFAAASAAPPVILLHLL